MTDPDVGYFLLANASDGLLSAALRLDDVWLLNHPDSELPYKVLL